MLLGNIGDSHSEVAYAVLTSSMCAGAPGGTSLASASIVCQGPGAPVPLLGSTSLAAYSSSFQGVTFTQDMDPDGEHADDVFCRPHTVIITDHMHT